LRVLDGKGQAIQWQAAGYRAGVAPDGGNPSGRLMSLQLELCIDILRLEVELSGAQSVVFLTGYGWAKPFLEHLGVTNQLDSAGLHFVEFASRKQGVTYVVGQHPQGKPEEAHCDEIINALDQVKARKG
jgi:hypothetical protein